jgi:type II secretory pathway pseudopilin PulG
MNKIKGYLLYEKNGFTIVEVMVAFGLLSILGLAAAGLFQMMTKQQSSIQDKNTSMEVTTSMSQYLLSDLACTNEYIGKTIPSLGATAAFSVQAYKGLGTVATLSAGSTIFETTGNPLKILKLNISTPAGQVFKPTSNNLFYAQVEIQLQLAKNTTTFAPRTFNIPVLINAANQITKCQLTITADQFCSGLGAIYNPATGKCDFNSQCEQLGTYIVFAQSGDPAAFTAPRSSADNIKNPLTNAQSCPAAANRITPVSVYTWHNEAENPAKKEPKFMANMSETYYICQKCP